MQLKNCTLDDAVEIFKNKRIVPFGIGVWYNVMQYTVLRRLKDFFSYAIDNKNCGKTVTFANKELPVFSPEVLRQEKECIVLITSPSFMYEMYAQLQELDLDDSILCYAFPFMQKITPIQKKTELEKLVTNGNSTHLIPKILHSFWFSGEPKPASYKKCIDTWAEKCPDYKIIEWNKENYDFEKNAFCKSAIECGAWAFAADYARLDVVYRMGGIYLDMDVELLKTLDIFLGNKAIFPFYTSCAVDLAFFGAQKDLPLISKMLQLYEMSDPPKKKGEFSNFFQPSYVAEIFYNEGLSFDGSLQCIDGMTFFPKNYFMPLDVVTFDMTAQTKSTYAIHHVNFGWGTSERRNQKMINNRKLWSMVCDNR